MGWLSKYIGYQDKLLRGTLGNSVADAVQKTHGADPIRGNWFGLAGESVGNKGKVESGLTPGSAGSASNINAGLIREQWQDYLTRFAPYEEMLVNLATGEEDNVQAENRAVESVNTAYDTAGETYGRNRSRFGLSDSAEQGKSRNHQTGLSRTASEVGAINTTRLQTQDRDMNLIAGGMSVGQRGQ